MNSRLWLVLILASLAAAGMGYTRGVSNAEARFRMLLAQEVAARAQENEARAKEDLVRAETVAEAERAARVRLQAETERAAALSAQLVAARQQVADERRTFTRKLAYATEKAQAYCSGLPPEWVGLYNEATRSGFFRSEVARSDSRARGTRAVATGIATTASTSRTVTAGIRGGTSMSTEPLNANIRLELDSPLALATPADVLAHVRDYGGYCRSLEAQVKALTSLTEPQ